MATANGHLEAIEILSSAPGIDINAQSSVSLKFDNDGQGGETPLHRAIFWGKSDAVVILLQKGANPYIMNTIG